MRLGLFLRLIAFMCVYRLLIGAFPLSDSCGTLVHSCSPTRIRWYGLRRCSSVSSCEVLHIFVSYGRMLSLYPYSFGWSPLSGRSLCLVRSRDSSLVFFQSLPSRLFLRELPFRALPGLGCVGFSVPFQPAETSGGRLVPLCPRQHSSPPLSN